MRNVKLFALIALGVTACTDNAYDPNAPAIDPNAPRVHITSPARGTIAGDVKTVTVTGTVTDDSGAVDSLKVNDVVATVAADGSFTAQVPVAAGTNLLHAVAKDKQGNTGKETRAVVAGPMVTLARHIPDAITATISAQTIDAIGRGASSFIQNGDLTAAVAPMNPVVNSGAPNGPDCLYAQAHITSMDVGTADILMTPQNGSILLSGDLNNVTIGMHLQWAVSCLDGSRDITISAQHIGIQGNLVVGLIGRDFDIRLENQNVQVDGFNLQLGGVPQTIIDMLNLNSTFGSILGWATERFVVPMLNNTLEGLNETITVDVFGKQIDIDLEPSQINFTREGGLVMLNTSLRARGDAGSFVFVENTIPAMDMSQGFQLAVADDAANQLFTSLWSAKALDMTLELATGSYGEVGKLYDSVQIAAAVPPHVDASGEGLKLTVGDMMATFRNGSSIATQVAINAEVALKVVKGSDDKLRFDVGTPTVFVDILDDVAIEGSNQLSTAEFESIISFAASRIVSVGSGSLGAIPLPSLGGVSLTNLSIMDEFGYLIVAGEVQ